MKKEKSDYKISVEIGKEVYTGKGATALEALQTLTQPVKIFQKGIVVMSHGKKKRVMMLMPQRLKRLWWKLAQPVLAKDFERGLLGMK